MINDYFPVSTFQGSPSFKGTFEPNRIENSAHLFDVPGGAGRWLVISLEFGPRDTVLAWANDIAKQYADTPAMLLTHAYLYDDNTRYDHVARPSQQWNPHSYPIGMNAGDANDGEEMWQKLVLGNSNIRFVLSGHVLEHRRGPAIEHAAGRNGGAPDPGQLSDLRPRRRRLPARDAVLPRGSARSTFRRSRRRSAP